MFHHYLIYRILVTTTYLFLLFSGNIAYIPRELSSHGCPSLSELDDGCSHRGVYLLRTTSQHCCEFLDQRGNAFSAYSNGEIKIDESKENDTSMPSNG